MFKYIITLFIAFSFTQYNLYCKSHTYDWFDYPRTDENGKYILIAQKGEYYGLIDLFGNQIIKPEYTKVQYFKEGLIKVYKDSLTGIFDLQGNNVLPIEYTESVFKYALRYNYLKGDHFYLIHKDGKYGVFDTKNKKIIVAAQYDRIEGKDFGLDIANVSQPQYKGKSQLSVLVYNDQKQGLIDLNTGDLIINIGLYDDLKPSDKLGCIVVSKDGKKGVIDYNQNVILPFQDNHLAIRAFGYLSYMDRDSQKEFISNRTFNRSKKYDNIFYHSAGLSRVQLNNYVGVIDSLGNEIIPPLYNSLYISDNYIETIVYTESEDYPIRQSFFDKAGKIILADLKFNDVQYYEKSKLFVVRNKDNKVGLLDKKGKTIMPLKYRRIYIDEKANIIRYEIDDKAGNSKMGLATIGGRILLKPIYDEIDVFTDNVAQIGVNTKDGYLHGLINIKGHEIVKPQFTSIVFEEASKNKFVKIIRNNKVGVLFRNGKITIEPQYDEILFQNLSSNISGRIAITKRHRSYGLVNIETGKELLEATNQQIVSIRNADSHLFCIRNQQGSYLLNKDGFMLIPFTPKVLYPLGYNSNNLKALKQINTDNKQGLVDLMNQELIPCIYDNIDPLKDDLLRVERNHKLGIVSLNNQVIMPLEYDYIQSDQSSKASNLLFAKRGHEYGYIFLDKMIFTPSIIAQDLAESMENRIA